MSATPREKHDAEVDSPDSEATSDPLADRYPINQPDTFERVAADDRDDSLPTHLIEIRNPNHTAVCADCGNWVQVGPDGTEYGHRQECDHRPSCVETWCPRDTAGEDQ